MTFIIFLTSFLLYLLVSSICITSFFAITRGETEVLPDGSVHKFGKLLKGYYFFWFKEKSKQKIYYSGDELGALMLQFKEYYTGELSLLGNVYQPVTVTLLKAPREFEQYIPALRQKFDIGFESVEHAGDYTTLAVFWLDTEYIFPAWLRTVMAGCITCTPTIYGNIIYWATIVLIKDSILYQSLFGIFNDHTQGVIALWLLYWISLAWTNTVLWKIYNKN